MDPVPFDSHVLHQFLEQVKFSARVEITFQVMAFAGMSAGDPDAVGPLTKGDQSEFGTHAAGAGNPHYPDVGGILHPADARQICSAIAAPVT